MKKLKRAIFLDRDGTIIEDRGFLSDPSQVHFYENCFEPLSQLKNEFLLFIVTNQSGIADKVITLEQANLVNQFVVKTLERHQISITEVYTCPHNNKDNCDCKKPKTFFLEEAAKKYNLDLKNSFVIGDHPHDVELALNVGATGIYVLTGHGEKHKGELAPGSLCSANLREAAELIIAKSGSVNAISPPGSAGHNYFHHPTLEIKMLQEIQNAAKIIRNGGVGSFPTETVYGLGANALDKNGVARIFEIKKRPFFDPLIVHIANREQLSELVQDIPPLANKLIDHFWPGPLTLVLQKKESVPDIVTSGNPTVAVRMPEHPIALELLKMAGVPIAAPSANLFGRTSPTTAEHVQSQLGSDIDFLLDGGPCSVGVESTILSLITDPPVLLRSGGTPIEAIEALIGTVTKLNNSSTENPVAPGQLLEHYAPRTPLRFIDSAKTIPHNCRVGFISFQGVHLPEKITQTEILSAQGSLTEAAANLFAAMHRLDALGLDLILCEKFPDRSLGIAINDRLTRASAKTKF